MISIELMRYIYIVHVHIHVHVNIREIHVISANVSESLQNLRKV